MNLSSNFEIANTDRIYLHGGDVCLNLKDFSDAVPFCHSGRFFPKDSYVYINIIRSYCFSYGFNHFSFLIEQGPMRKIIQKIDLLDLLKVEHSRFSASGVCSVDKWPSFLSFFREVMDYGIWTFLVAGKCFIEDLNARPEVDLYFKSGDIFFGMDLDIDSGIAGFFRNLKCH